MTSIKPYLIAAALTVCMLVGGGVVWVFTRDAVHTLENANADLSARNQALTVANKALLDQSKTRAARNAATAAATKARTNDLDQALKANPAWAAQRVPDDVAAALGVRPASEASTAVRP